MITRIGTALVGGVAGVVGGSVWILHAVLLAARPAGCVGAAECGVAGGHRASEDLAWLFLIAVALLGTCMAGAFLSAGSAAAGRRSPRAAMVLMATGGLLVLGGVVVNSVMAGDSPLWWLHDTDTLGRIIPVVASVVAGLAAVRRLWFNRWAGVLLMGAAVASLPFNVQDDRVLLNVPLGGAWVLAAGSVLPRHGRRRGQAPSLGVQDDGRPEACGAAGGEQRDRRRTDDGGNRQYGE